jgi:hypothetical protein
MNFEGKERVLCGVHLRRFTLLAESGEVKAETLKR